MELLVVVATMNVVVMLNADGRGYLGGAGDE